MNYYKYYLVFTGKKNDQITNSCCVYDMDNHITDADQFNEVYQFLLSKGYTEAVITNFILLSGPNRQEDQLTGLHDALEVANNLLIRCYNNLSEGSFTSEAAMETFDTLENYINGL